MRSRSIYLGDCLGGLSRILCAGAILVAVLAFVGCGKKAPPVAPQSPSLLAVNDLKLTAQGAGATLTWHHSPDSGPVAGYLVLRAQAKLDQPECPGCPRVFQKVQTLRLSWPRRHQAQTMTFNQNLSDGFIYTYSVRPFHTSGRQGPDSNLVEIVRLPAGTPAPDNDDL